jgi:hypothetical protein
MHTGTVIPVYAILISCVGGGGGEAGIALRFSNEIDTYVNIDTRKTKYKLT